MFAEHFIQTPSWRRRIWRPSMSPTAYLPSSRCARVGLRSDEVRRPSRRSRSGRVLLLGCEDPVLFQLDDRAASASAADPGAATAAAAGVPGCGQPSCRTELPSIGAEDDERMAVLASSWRISRPPDGTRGHRFACRRVSGPAVASRGASGGSKCFAGSPMRVRARSRTANANVEAAIRYASGGRNHFHSFTDNRERW